MKQALLTIGILALCLLSGCKSTPVQHAQTAPLTASGFIEAEEIAIAPEVGGRVMHISADIGQEVAGGDLLVRLDDRIPQAQLAMARAKVQEAESRLAMARNGATAAERAVAKAQLAQAQAAQLGACQAWADAQSILDNPQELDRQLAVARARVQAAEAAVQVATAYKDAAEIGADFFYRGRETVGNLPDKVTVFDGGINNLPTEVPSEVRDFLEQNPVDGTYKYGDFEIVVEDGHITASQYLDIALPTGAHFAPNTYWQAWVGVNSAQAGYDGARQALSLLYALRADPYQIQAQVDEAEAQCRQAQAQEAMAQAHVDALHKGAMPEEIAALEAALQQAEAEMAQAHATLAQYSLHAPTGGAVLDRTAEPGELIAPGVAALVLAKLNTIYIQVHVPNAELGRVALGQSVKVCANGFAACASGEVVYIGQEAAFPPKNVPKETERPLLAFAVRVRISNREGHFKPGMPADVQFIE